MQRALNFVTGRCVCTEDFARSAHPWVLDTASGVAVCRRCSSAALGSNRAVRGPQAGCVRVLVPCTALPLQALVSGQSPLCMWSPESAARKQNVCQVLDEQNTQNSSIWFLCQLSCPTLLLAHNLTTRLHLGHTDSCSLHDRHRHSTVDRAVPQHGAHHELLQRAGPPAWASHHQRGCVQLLRLAADDVAHVVVIWVGLHTLGGSGGKQACMGQPMQSLRTSKQDKQAWQVKPCKHWCS